MSVIYRIDPATPEEIDWIAELESEVYSQRSAVPRPVLKDWYDANPDGFSIIRRNNQKIGHVDILPLRPSMLEIFQNGEVAERDIPGNCLYVPAEQNLIRHLYIESLIIQPPKEHWNARLPSIRYLFSNFISLVNRICKPNNVEDVYAIAASKSGARLMKQLGFNQLKSGQDRTDGHDLYTAKFVDLMGRISKFSSGRLRAAATGLTNDS